MLGENGRHGTHLVVVGAGPGGMGAAYYAARLGLSVALVERDRLPRDRVCGDGMLAQTVSEMERLGLGDWLLEPRHGRIEGVAVRAQTARFDEPLPPDPRASRGYIVRRREFEPKIMERVVAAGATVHDGTEATRLLRSSSGGVSGVEAVSEGGETLRFEAPLVVDVGGFGGNGEFGDDGGEPGSMVVSRQYFAGLPDPGKVGLPGRNYLHLWYAGELPRLGVGYGRIFYLSDGSANVGIALYGRNLPKKPDARLAALCRLHKGFLAGPEVSGMLDGAAPEEEMQRRVFRAGGAGVRARHAQGLLEAGDAGGASHPTSGEGIGFALAAGRLAAGWAQEAHRRRDFSTGLLSGYTRQLRSLHSVEQTSTHALVALVNRLAALEPMEPVLARCPTDARLRRTVVEALIGNTAAATLLRCHPATSARTAATTLRKLARAARTWK